MKDKKRRIDKEVGTYGTIVNPSECDVPVAERWQ
jgi:hypothetical protein